MPIKFDTIMGCLKYDDYDATSSQNIPTTKTYNIDDIPIVGETGIIFLDRTLVDGEGDPIKKRWYMDNGELLWELVT
jgi:hypothetical protein